MTKVFLLVVSLWGYNGSAWVYTGNQMVMNEPMPKEQCEQLIADTSWSKHITNEYYGIKFDCMPESKELKEEL